MWRLIEFDLIFNNNYRDKSEKWKALHKPKCSHVDEDDRESSIKSGLSVRIPIKLCLARIWRSHQYPWLDLRLVSVCVCRWSDIGSGAMTRPPLPCNHKIRTLQHRARSRISLQYHYCHPYSTIFLCKSVKIWQESTKSPIDFVQMKGRSRRLEF